MWGHHPSLKAKIPGEQGHLGAPGALLEQKLPINLVYTINLGADVESIPKYTPSRVGVVHTKLLVLS